MPPLKIFDTTLTISPDDVLGGHVNNAKFFAYVGEAFGGWYASMGFVGVDGPITGPLMAHQELDFLSEMTYPGNVLCRLTVTRIGKSSLEHAIDLRNADQPDVLCARGKEVNVWFDRDLGRAATWPDDMLAKCWEA